MKTNGILILLTTFSIVFGLALSFLVWDHISFPFSNPNNVVGKLALAEFNPLNNYVRWGTSLILPTSIFLISFYILTRKKILVIANTTQHYDAGINTEIHVKNRPLIIYSFFVLTLLYIVLSFFSKGWSTSAFDMFHEGEQLTPAFNLVSKGGLWTGTLFVHGALYDVYTAVLGWKIFGADSIGSFRIFAVLLTVLKDAALLCLCFKAFRFICIQFKDLGAGLTIVGTATLIYSLTTNIQNLDRRVLPFLIFLILAIYILEKERKYLYLLMGFISGLSFFYSLDIGLFSSVSIFLFISIRSILFKENPVKYMNLMVLAVSGFVSSWIIVFVLTGKQEFSAFLNNFMYFVRNKDLLDSYVYPHPGLASNFRFSAPIIISAINIILGLILHLSYYSKRKAFTKIEVLHAVLVFSSLILYRTALGRSDLLHVETSSSFIFIVMGFNIGLFFYILSIPAKIKNLYQNILIIFIFTTLIFGFSRIDLHSALSFPKRVTEFVSTSDSAFINTSRVAGTTRLQEIFKSEKCIINLSSEASLPYLIKKPSCGRIYISYLAAANPMRQELLETIQKEKPKYLIYSSKIWTQDLDNINNQQRFPTLMDYVDSHYKFFEAVSDYWIVYEQRI